MAKIVSATKISLSNGLGYPEAATKPNHFNRHRQSDAMTRRNEDWVCRLIAALECLI